MSIDRWRARRHFFIRVAVLVWIVFFGSVHVLEVAIPDRPGKVSLDARLELRWLERVFARGEVPFVDRAFPEGELFFYEFYGLALQNVAETTRDPDDIARAAREVRAMLPKIDALLTHQPFASMQKAEVRGGICWFAGQNLLRARLIALSGAPDPAEIKRFHADSATLERAFQRSATGVLEAYPGMTWPVDSLFGYRSLQIHDQLYGTTYGGVFEKFERSMRRTLDPATGLMPSFLYASGRPRDLPRGCAMSWSLAVLRDLDPTFADEQWAAYRRSFGRCAFGLCLFREYPPGVSRFMDADSGPIIAGLGMSASGFALAAARAEGDMETAESLRRTGELFGFPAVSWWGKRYLGGEIAMFDIFSVWTRTLPTPAVTRPDQASAWPVITLLAGFWAALAWRAQRAVRRAREELAASHGESSAQRALFFLAVLALIVHVVWPAFVGAALLGAWSVIGLLSAITGIGVDTRGVVQANFSPHPL